jgi:hypothetical protein
MPRLAKGFAIKEILFIKVDLRQILGAELYLDPAGGTGGVPTTIVIQRTPEQLRGLQQRRIGLNFSALAISMEKRHARHRESPSMYRCSGRHWLIGTALQSNMFFKLVTKQFHAALNQDGSPGDQCAIASPLHKSTEL